MGELASGGATRRRSAWAGGLAVGLLLAAASVAAPAGPVAEAADALARGSPQSAVEVLREHLGTNPSSADGNRLLGIALSLLGQRSEALAALERAVAAEEANAANHLALGQALAQFGELERAKESFRAAIGLNGDLAPAHEGLALSLALDGALDEALTHFTAALERSGESAARARLHYFRGKAYAQLSVHRKARSDFESAVALQPDFGAAYLEWGRILAEDAEVAVAEPVLRKAAGMMPESFEAQYLHGQQLIRAGDPEAAVAPLQRAVGLAPADRSARYALGRALRAAGRTDEAREVLSALSGTGSDRAFSESSINEAGRRNNLGLEAEAAGDLESALAHYEAAAAIAPEGVEFHRNAALALGRLQRWTEAKARLRSVLRMAPGDFDATKALYVALDHAPD